MQVFELAKRYGMKAGEVVQLLRKAEFTIKSHMSIVTDEMEKAVCAKLDSQTQQMEKDAGIPLKEPEKDAPERKFRGMELNDGQEEVIFFSTSRCHDIAFKKEVYFPGTPKIRDAAQSIRFDDYEYRTGDPEKIEFIKNTRSFKVRSTSYPKGKIRIVTEEELAVLKKARQPKVTEIKSTGDRSPEDVDMSLHNPLPV